MRENDVPILKTLRGRWQRAQAELRDLQKLVKDATGLEIDEALARGGRLLQREGRKFLREAGHHTKRWVNEGAVPVPKPVRETLGRMSEALEALLDQPEAPREAQPRSASAPSATATPETTEAAANPQRGSRSRSSRGRSRSQSSRAQSRPTERRSKAPAQPKPAAKKRSTPAKKVANTRAKE